jgi:hypothetical protein
MTKQTFCRRLLKVHGTILTIIAIANAIVVSVCHFTGSQPFAFLMGNKMAWVGLIQAYLLISIISVLLVVNANNHNTRRWHIVGALAHCPPLLAALTSLDFFDEMGKLSVGIIAIGVHITFFCLESTAVILSRKNDCKQ